MTAASHESMSLYGSMSCMSYPFDTLEEYNILQIPISWFCMITSRVT